MVSHPVDGKGHSKGSNICSLGQKDAEASETEAEGMMALTWERAGMVEGPEERQCGWNF